MTLEQLKKEAREEYELKRVYGYDSTRTGEFLDTLIDRVVSVVEAEVVPEKVNSLKEHTNCRCTVCTVETGANLMRAKVLEAFARLRGEITEQNI